jgi:hypothetical protein
VEQDEASWFGELRSVLAREAPDEASWYELLELAQRWGDEGSWREIAQPYLVEALKQPRWQQVERECPRAWVRALAHDEPVHVAVELVESMSLELPDESLYAAIGVRVMAVLKTLRLRGKLPLSALSWLVSKPDGAIAN